VQFLDRGRQDRHVSAIISEGLQWYSEYILQRAGIADIPGFTNQISFENSIVRLEFPWFDMEIPRRDICKSWIARAFKQSGDNVVFIADSRTESTLWGKSIACWPWLVGRLLKRTRSGNPKIP
jgi:hypothetical protein